MKRLKRIFVFLIIFLVVYISLNLVYKSIVLNDKYVDAYILNKDIIRGNSIARDDVYKIKINKEEYKKEINLIQNEFNEYDLARINLTKGSIITKDLFVKKEEYSFEDGKEIVSINLDKKDISTNIRLEKGTLVNIYFIKENELDESKRVELLAKNVKVIDVNDDEGNSISKSKNVSKIIVSLTSDKVMLINRYNKIGCFNVSLVN